MGGIKSMKVAKDFRLSKNKAEEITKDVGAAVKTWKEVALAIGITKR